MRRIAEFIHHSDFPTKEESEARWKRVDVRSGYHGTAGWREELTNIFQEIDGAFDMLDDLDGDDQVEGTCSDRLSEMPIVQILCEELLTSLIGGGIAVNGEHIESQTAEPLAHCAGSGTQIEGAASIARGVRDDAEYKIVQTRWRGGSRCHYV